VKLHLRPVNSADLMCVRGVYAGYAAAVKLPCSDVHPPMCCPACACLVFTDKLSACFSFKPEAYPAVPGLEGVGVVVKTGPGASKLKARSQLHACARILFPFVLGCANLVGSEASV